MPSRSVFRASEMPRQIEENSLIFQFETAIRLEETEIISQEKAKKKKAKNPKQNKRKLKEKSKTPQPKNLKRYFVYFQSHQVKKEQEFKCLCCIYLFFWMTGFFRIRLRSWTSHCICCGCFIRNAGSICQPGSVLRLLLRDTRRQLIRRASEGQLIASSLSVPGNI